MLAPGRVCLLFLSVILQSKNEHAYVYQFEVGAGKTLNFMKLKLCTQMSTWYLFHDTMSVSISSPDCFALGSVCFEV